MSDWVVVWSVYKRVCAVCPALFPIYAEETIYKIGSVVRCRLSYLFVLVMAVICALCSVIYRLVSILSLAYNFATTA